MRRLGMMLVLAALLIGCGGQSREQATDEVSGDLIIFHAGSLSVPVQELTELFEAKYPSVSVKAEAAGSRHCARKISDLHKPCDVMMSADTRVVESLLMPEYARFNIQFATNQMAIAYLPESKFADEINADNWPDVLLREGAIFGRAEAESDPCGYRTLLVFQLAERAFDSPGLAEKLTQADAVIRSKETDLLALLDAGEIDYLFIYRSVAAQHGLKMIQLPDEVNLRSADLADVYAAASVRLTGKTPGEWITRKGEPMVYSATIPLDPPNPAAAEAWMAMLLSADGREIMERNGQPFLTPPTADGLDAMPDGLRSLCVSRAGGEDAP
jgi:molybdate/tungstate transport system substrate-binding protein